MRAPAGRRRGGASSGPAAAFRRSFRSRRNRTSRRPGEPSGAGAVPGAGGSSSAPFSGSFSGFLKRSGISMPPAKPSTCGPAPDAPGAKLHQSGSTPSAGPSSSSPARWGGTFCGSFGGVGAGLRHSPPPRCTGTAGTDGAEGAEGAAAGAGGRAGRVSSPRVSRTSSGVPIRSRIRRTAAGVSGSYLARRRSISSRSPDTSLIRSPDDSCLRCAKSPTRLRYS